MCSGHRAIRCLGDASRDHGSSPSGQSHPATRTNGGVCQREHLAAAIRELVLDNQLRRSAICWYVSASDLKPATHPLLPRPALLGCGPGTLELRLIVIRRPRRRVLTKLLANRSDLNHQTGTPAVADCAQSGDRTRLAAGSHGSGHPSDSVRTHQRRVPCDCERRATSAAHGASVATLVARSPSPRSALWPGCGGGGSPPRTECELPRTDMRNGCSTPRRPCRDDIKCRRRSKTRP